MACRRFWNGRYCRQIKDILRNATSHRSEEFLEILTATDIRSEYPEQLIFNCEEVKVMIKHIGGYPGRYAPGVKDIIQKEKIKLFISGHSHILKIIYDEKLECLHMNPGAAGNQGWHQMRTIIRFTIDGKDIRNCEVIELGKR